MASAKSKQVDPTLSEIINKVNKALGKTGKVYFADQHPPQKRIRTGILALDMIMGGGLPRGKYTEFAGEESSGKSTAALIASAAVQREGGLVVWAAREGFDRKWAERWGVDLKKLILLDAVYGDTMLETAMTLIDEGVVDLFTLDSVQSFGTEREAEAGLEAESFGGGGAGQLWGRVMRRMYAAAAGKGENTAIIGISQVRAPIGKQGFKGQAPEPEPSGIKAIRHMKAISIRFKKGEPLYEYPNDTDKKRLVAREFKIKCTKNKTWEPERAGSFTIHYRPHDIYEFGIDSIEQVVRLGRVYELITSKGAWLEGYGIRAQGMEQYTAALRKKPDTALELETDILEAAK